MSAALPSMTSSPAKWKPYPAYKDSDVESLGEIPAHWQTKKLKFLAQVRTGITKGRILSSTATLDLPYLRVANVQSGYLNLDDISTITIGVDEVAGYALKICDVLMNEGGDYDKLGRGTVWNGQIDPCLHQNHVFAVRPKQCIESYWLATVTLTTYAKHFFIIKSKQSTNFASISSTNLAELPVVVPPPAERVAIQRYIDREGARIDALVTKKERLIELLQEKRTALIGQAVTNGLDPTVPMKDSGVEWLGEIPAHWQVKRLKHITAEVTVGIVITPAKYYVDSGVSCLRSLNVREGWLDDNDLVFISPESNMILRKSMIFAGDLVTVRTGQPGTTAVVDERFHGANCIDLIITRQSAQFDSSFMAHVANSHIATTQFCSGSDGAIQQHFNVETAKNLLVPLPPPEEQRSIAAFLDSEAAKIDMLIAKVREHIEKLREYRVALISAAVTGKVDVRGEVT